MQNLKKIRLEKKMNQLNLGMKVGVDQVSISAYEIGKSYPSIHTLLKLCNLFHVSCDFLLDLTDTRTPVNELVINNFTTEELEFLELFRRIPQCKKERALGILIGLSEHC
ncbi:MAG: helix-turn-helix transcriptional regulator [Anaerovorax sp.]|nr:helix-turn-helix transcriptional regulator [Anaerovorax sp.]